jgi:hypothetical protein
MRVIHGLPLEIIPGHGLGHTEWTPLPRTLNPQVYRLDKPDRCPKPVARLLISQGWSCAAGRPKSNSRNPLRTEEGRDWAGGHQKRGGKLKEGGY